MDKITKNAKKNNFFSVGTHRVRPVFINAIQGRIQGHIQCVPTKFVMHTVEARLIASLHFISLGYSENQPYNVHPRFLCVLWRLL